MEKEVLESLLVKGGIGALAIGVFFYFAREAIKNKIFPMLSRKQAFNIIVIFLFCIWTTAMFGMWLHYKEKADIQIASRNLGRLTAESRNDLDQNKNHVLLSRGFGNSNDTLPAASSEMLNPAAPQPPN